MATGIRQRRQQAQEEFQQHVGESQSADTVRCLLVGLNSLRKLLLRRLHNDVEAYYGVDPFLAPSNEREAQSEMRHAAGELEVYSQIVVLAEVARGGYVRDQLSWFRDWLIRLRWGNTPQPAVTQRMQLYEPKDDNHRRHMFASLIEQALPEATKAPLVIYRLYPRSIRIVTAVAFGDMLRAKEIRQEQIQMLPAIGDCHECHGFVLNNGEVCRRCGNPLWKINWMRITE
jgi:hypothetical protein